MILEFERARLILLIRVVNQGRNIPVYMKHPDSTLVPVKIFLVSVHKIQMPSIGENSPLHILERPAIVFVYRQLIPSDAAFSHCRPPKFQVSELESSHKPQMLYQSDYFRMFRNANTKANLSIYFKPFIY